MSGERICPNCGDGFAAGGRGLGRRFCSQGCKKAFHNRSNGEGAAAIALVKAWVGTRHAPAGSSDARICKQARRELTRLAQILNERDREAGRPPASAYVDSLLGETTVIDRVRP